MITHIHVCQQLDKPFKIWKSEIYFTISQALLWKKLYKWPTKLYCDTNTIEIFKSLDILDIWDQIDDTLLSETAQINKTRFWSSGKLSVMNAQKNPYVMSDLDFVNYTDMFDYNYFNGYDFGAYHYEARYSANVYKNPKQKLLEVNMKPLKWMWWFADPINTCSFYMGNMELNKKYTEFSLEYIKRASKLENPSFTNNEYTVFAEQQVLAAILKFSKYKYTTMLAGTYHDGFKWKKSKGLWSLEDGQKHAMHLWLDKYFFAKNNKEQEYIDKLYKVLKNIAPEIIEYIDSKLTSDILEKNKQFIRI